MKQTDRESRTRGIKLTAFFGVLAVLCGVMTAGLIMGAASAGLLGALGMIFA